MDYASSAVFLPFMRQTGGHNAAKEPKAFAVSCSNSLCQAEYGKHLWVVGNSCSCRRGTPGRRPGANWNRTSFCLIFSVLLKTALAAGMSQTYSNCHIISSVPSQLNMFSPWHMQNINTYFDLRMCDLLNINSSHCCDSAHVESSSWSPDPACGPFSRQHPCVSLSYSVCPPQQLCKAFRAFSVKRF